MKAAFLLAVLIVGVLIQDSEASFFRDLGRSIRDGVRSIGSGVKQGIRQGGRAIGDGIRGAIRGAGQRLIDRLRKRIESRGKRSAIAWKTQQNDMNTVDIAKTFNLDLPLVEDMFIAADVDKSGSLDGQEVLVFLGLIDATVRPDTSIPVPQ